MARSFLDRGVYLLGQNYKRSVVLLPAATVVATVGAALAGRVWPQAEAIGLLSLHGVGRGEVWRLVTWPFFQPDILWLVMSSWAMLFLGRDLAERWGSRRFLTLTFALIALVGALTLATAWIGRDLAGGLHGGTWPLVSAMSVAWATLFASRQILVFFVIPASGQSIIALTIALTFIVGALNGFPLVVPAFYSIGLTLGYLRLWPLIVARAGSRRRRQTTPLRLIVKQPDPPEPPRWVH